MRYTIICVALVVMTSLIVLHLVREPSPEKMLFKSVCLYQSKVIKPHAWWLDTGLDAVQNGPKNKEVLDRIDRILEVLRDHKDVNDITRKLYDIVCRSAWGVIVDTKTIHPGRKAIIVKEGTYPVMVFVARDYGEQRDMRQELLCYRADYRSVYIGAIEMPSVFLAATLYHEIGHFQQGIVVYDEKDLPTVEVPMHKLSLEILCAKIPEYAKRLELIASRHQGEDDNVITPLSFEDLHCLNTLVLEDTVRYGHLVPYMTTNHILGVSFIRAKGNFELEARAYNWLRKVFR